MTARTPPSLAVCPLGVMAYPEAFELQRTLVEARRWDRIEDVLLLLEHPPTITHSFTGRGSEHLLGDRDLLAERGVAVHTTDRGGDITFHGPGQLVGYPILKLSAEAGERDLHRYLRQLEEVLIRAAATYGLETKRLAGRTGTWLADGSRKLAAIGVKASRWVTLHGFALNVDVDLSYFDLIVPCGISDAGVANLSEFVDGEAPALAEVGERVSACFAEVFERTASPPSESLSKLLPEL